jgi:hypothetical protein
MFVDHLDAPQESSMLRGSAEAVALAAEKIPQGLERKRIRGTLCVLLPGRKTDPLDKTFSTCNGRCPQADYRIGLDSQY